MAQILAGNAPVSVPEGPALVFHACPVNAPDSWVRFRHSPQQIVSHLRPIGKSMGKYHFNRDGFLVAGWVRDRPPNAYVQLFRDGTLEAVNVGEIGLYQPQGYGLGFAGYPVERVLIEAVTNFQEAWKALDVNPPLAIGLTISGVHGAHMFPASQSFRLPDAVIDRDVVIVPEVVVDDLSAPADVLLRPVFDLLWNSAGWGESPHYRDGSWVER